MTAYYNENDPHAAAWLRELIAAGEIAPGVVDTRDIRNVRSEDLRGFVQCHFFAGIGGWPRALRLAGWGDERPVWTGSCPCQPFSAAGKRKGVEDERHLWPVFADLIGECGPATVFGEQVASRDGRDWLASVRADLERMEYAVGAADLCAAGVGAPHIRQRLYWAAHAYDDRRGIVSKRDGQTLARCEACELGSYFDGRCCLCGLGNPHRFGRLENGLHVEGASEAYRRRSADWACNASKDGGMEHSPGDGREQRRAEPGGRGIAGGRGEVRGLADADSRERNREPKGQGCELDGPPGRRNEGDGFAKSSGRLGFWSAVEWLPCSDGKYRPVEPGTFPLAHGVPGRVGRLRGYGNAIVPQVAAQFVIACEESLAELRDRY